MPGTVCSVALCRSNSSVSKRNGETISFFTFPKDDKLRKKWVKKCYRKDKFNPENKRICSKHFKIGDFDDVIAAKLKNTVPRKLKCDAVPSLFLLPIHYDSDYIEERIASDEEREIRARKDIIEKLSTAAMNEERKKETEDFQVSSSNSQIVTENEHLLQEKYDKSQSRKCKAEKNLQIVSSKDVKTASLLDKELLYKTKSIVVPIETQSRKRKAEQYLEISNSSKAESASFLDKVIHGTESEGPIVTFKKDVNNYLLHIKQVNDEQNELIAQEILKKHIEIAIVLLQKGITARVVGQLCNTLSPQNIQTIIEECIDTIDQHCINRLYKMFFSVNPIDPITERESENKTDSVSPIVTFKKDVNKYLLHLKQVIEEQDKLIAQEIIKKQTIIEVTTKKHIEIAIMLLQKGIAVNVVCQVCNTLSPQNIQTIVEESIDTIDQHCVNRLYKMFSCVCPLNVRTEQESDIYSECVVELYGQNTNFQVIDLV